MKQYFTKWLPVEGEIKEGDIYHNGTGIGPAYKGENWIGQKVKLFLCSRDIKVGDEFRSLLYPNKTLICLERPADRLGYTQPMGCYYTEQDGFIQWVPWQEAYKVIGEVSPEAIWVTADMEFDEGEVKLRYDSQLLSLDHFWPKDIPKIIHFRCPTCHKYH